MVRASRVVRRKPEGPGGLLETCRTVPARRFARPAECHPGGSEEPPGRMLRRRAARPDVPAPRTMPATPPARMADASPGRLGVPPNDVVDAGAVPSSQADKDRRVSVAGHAATLQPGQPTHRLVRRRHRQQRTDDPTVDWPPCGSRRRMAETVQQRTAVRPRHPETRRTRLQGIEPRESPCSQPPGVTRAVGADPLLGFHLPRVFSPPAVAVPSTRPPLAHLELADAETAAGPVPQSVSEQEDWLASLEVADPFEVPVLVFVRRNDRSRPTRTGLDSGDPASGNSSEDETGSRRRRPGRSAASCARRAETRRARPATGAA